MAPRRLVSGTCLAKALQPYRADQHGQGWLVGSEMPPPAPVFETTSGDILVTLHKRQERNKEDHVVLSSIKTKSHMKQAPLQRKKKVEDKENIAPWSGRDPWGGYNKFREVEEGDQRMTPVSKWDKLQGEVQGVVASSVKLETGMSELRHQNQKFENWFHEAGQSNASLRQEVGVLISQVKEHQQTIQHMGCEIKSGFQDLEALLSKKQRSE